MHTSRMSTSPQLTCTSRVQACIVEVANNATSGSSRQPKMHQCSSRLLQPQHRAAWLRGHKVGPAAQVLRQPAAGPQLCSPRLKSCVARAAAECELAGEPVEERKQGPELQSDDELVFDVPEHIKQRNAEFQKRLRGKLVLVRGAWSPACPEALHAGLRSEPSLLLRTSCHALTKSPHVHGMAPEYTPRNASHALSARTHSGRRH